MSELKPCPFCGSAPTRLVEKDVLSVECPRCVTVGFHNHVRFGCIAESLWNSRSREHDTNNEEGS
jgi:hypothetical protein